MDRKVRYAKAGSFNIAYEVVGDGRIDLILSLGWATHLDLAWEIPGRWSLYDAERIAAG